MQRSHPSRCDTGFERGPVVDIDGVGVAEIGGPSQQERLELFEDAWHELRQRVQLHRLFTLIAQTAHQHRGPGREITRPQLDPDRDSLSSQSLNLNPGLS